ncbi:hypothetical protein DMB95_02230 [Campylobacter sp. MIT 12-8780]|uniref:WbqC family protein n=1 Tax=unclassified Campylobacter TaxID=2593542 RepID=UPI00115F166F|nr:MULTISPECIES: WbqC family protein [unclassified Campylobacter]NDJ26720.1 WbqC family protein [Campylobacter sp. MIT 19-121]TQR42455.1 hypothetical protein DMB95_02230 [Campylobacter sp. MIT 12-8780]
MKIAIMQPTFLPWLGYLKMIQSVDAFVFLDCVQFEKRSWQSRNKIKLHGKEHTLSLSCHKAPQSTLIKDINLLDDDKYKLCLLKTIEHAYSKSVNFHTYEKILRKALFSFSSLCDFNIFLISQFCKDLNIQTPLLKASDMSLSGAKKEKLLLEICLKLKATHYLSPPGSKVYLDKPEAKEMFKAAMGGGH